MVRDKAGWCKEWGKVEGRDAQETNALPGLLTDGTGSLGHPGCGLSPSSMLSIGESAWHPVTSGIPNCYYNVTQLPVGVTVRFRVACANRAGQGPFSNPSEKVLVKGMQGQQERVVGCGQRRKGTLSPGSTPSLEHHGFAPGMPW